MTPLQYAAYVCLCALQRNPDPKMVGTNFEFIIETCHGRHFAAKADVKCWLDMYGTTPERFWSKEELKDLGYDG